MTQNGLVSLGMTAWLQVFLISVNTLFLARGIWLGVAIASWLISYTWVTNVRKVKDPSALSRIVYATGAMFGALSGILFVEFISMFL
jgi:hypothetical protein